MGKTGIWNQVVEGKVKESKVNIQENLIGRQTRAEHEAIFRRRVAGT
jgi:hypothetical protein